MIAVTGATGFLGGRLVDRLREAGTPVLAIGRDLAKLRTLDRLGVRTWACDLSHGLGAAELRWLEGAQAVVHCAALSSPFGPRVAFVRANLDATRHLAGAAAHLGTPRFVQISTPAVYFRPMDQELVREDQPLPPPVNAYAATKREAEVVARGLLGDRLTILRPRGIYGKGDTALLPRLRRAASQGPLPLLRGGRACTDLTHVEDAVEAILAALRPSAPTGGVYNISGGEALNVRTVIDTVARRDGAAVRWTPVPVGLAMAGARALEALAVLRGGTREPRVTPYALGLLAYTQTLDIGRARRELLWSPRTPFEVGLEEAFS